MRVAKLTAEGFLNSSPAPEIERRRLAGRKRRALVLTDEQAQHSFRATLPRHVKQGNTEDIPQNLWRLTRDDVRGFASVYFAVFAAVFVFII
ncbi:MAG: hypothetical protein AAGI28_00575 [Pseudomonadota bacterium]